MKKVLSFLFVATLLASCAGNVAGQTYRYPEYLTSGDTIWHTFPPTDSLYLHDQLVIKFRKGTLNKDSLCYDCHSIVKMGAEEGGKGAHIQSEGDDFFPVCKETLMAQRFSLYIIKDSLTRITLQNHGVSYLMRMTAANPCADTLSITRMGDTIPMDHFDWMVAFFNNDTSVVPTLINLFFGYTGVIEVAEPNYLGKYYSVTPHDPWYGSAPQKSLMLMGMPTAWGFEVGDSNQRVAVVDNGVDYWRCDLGNGSFGPGSKVMGGWDYTSKTASGICVGAKHGTQVASIIGAYSNNYGCNVTSSFAHGIAGIGGGWGTVGGDTYRGPGVSIVGYNVGNDKPNGAWAASAILEAAVRSAHSLYGYGAVVVNCSWGLGDTTVPAWVAIRDAVAETYLNNASLVAATGNNSASEYVYPACYEPASEIISVGSSDHRRRRMGGSYGSNWNNHIDLIAPGGALPKNPYDFSDSAIIVWALQSHNPDPPVFPNPIAVDSFYWFNGTSAAAAHVSGTLALLRSYIHRTGWFPFGPLPREDFEGILKASCRDFIGPDAYDAYQCDTGFDHHTGWGFLQADSMFRMLDPSGDYRYGLSHIEVADSNLVFGQWSSFYTHVLFYDPSSEDSLPTPNQYNVRIREVTGAAPYDASFYFPPVYTWGYTSHATKRGRASLLPNWKEPFCEVTDGEGGINDTIISTDTIINTVVAGIHHDHSTSVHLHTFQYDVCDLSGTHLFYYPTDNAVGLGYTVYGRTKVTSGVSKSKNTDGFGVWPSVATSHFNVEISESAHASIFRLFDNIGRIVSLRGITPGTHNFEIATGQLPSGVYIGRLLTERGMQEQKIIIRH